VPLEFETGNIVCVCNMTYCDTISKVTAVPADQFVQYSTSQSGLRFHKTEGLISDIPHSGGKMSLCLDWESWFMQYCFLDGCMAVISTRTLAVQPGVTPDFLQFLRANTKTVSSVILWLSSSALVPVHYSLSRYLMLCTRPGHKLSTLKLWKLTLIPWWQANILWHRQLLLGFIYSSASFTAGSTSHTLF